MIGIAATALSAALYGLLHPPFGGAALSWVALVPLALALRVSGPLRAAGLGWLFGALATLAVVAWLVPTLQHHFERSVGFGLGCWAALATFSVAPFYALAAAGVARALPTLPPSARPFAFAAGVVAAELARTHLGLRSPWALLGDAHAGSERLRQVADLTGVYGVSGLVALGNGVLAELLAALRRRRPEPRELRGALAAAGAFALLLTAALAYGAARLDAFAPAPGGLRVALVQANEAPALRWRSATADRVFGAYAALTREALRAGPEALPGLVLWPESALQRSPRDPAWALALDALASEAPLLVGAPRHERSGTDARAYNSAWLFQRGRPPQVADKRRLLPFVETALVPRRERDLEIAAFAAGLEPGLLTLGDDTLGVLICMEALYPALARALARGGATVLVNLSNDGWMRGAGGPEQSLAPAVFRAVETRLPLVRSTTTGLSAVIDPGGRTLALLSRGAAGVLVETLPRGARRPTLYARIGDAFAVACAALWLAAAVSPRSGKRASSGR